MVKIHSVVIKKSHTFSVAVLNMFDVKSGDVTILTELNVTLSELLQQMDNWQVFNKCHVSTNHDKYTNKYC